MGLFSNIFRKKERPAQNVQLIYEPGSVLSAIRGDAWANDTFRAAVDSIARNVARLRGSHVVTGGGAADARLNRMLQIQPNPLMTSYDMIYKLSVAYFTSNNGFAWLERDQRGQVVAIWPITSNSMEMLSDASGRLYGRFTLKDGQQAIFDYNDLVHLRRHFHNSDLLGDDNTALDTAVELAETANEGMTAAIRNGAAIRGVLSYTGLSKESKLQEMRDQFKATYLTPENSGGVVVVDNSAVYTPIKQEPVILSADQQKVIKSKILDYLGISDAILNSSFDENGFASFVEGTVEPFALQMGLAFTAKIFTPREIAYGNEIRFDYSRLYVSNSSKIALIKELTPYGLLSVNEGREIFDLPPVPDGDRRLQTLNVVDAGRANEYQLEDDEQ